MAWIFSLSAECGSDQNDVNQFAKHFQDMTWMMSNGCECQCRTDIFQDVEENWWCRVSPHNLSKEIGRASCRERV